MGFLKKLLGIGATAGATVAAVKVAEKYKENNPGGVQDVNNDGKVDVKDVVAEVAKAATEVYHDAAEGLAGIKEKASEYVEKGKDAVSDAAEDIKEKAPEYVEKVKDAVSDAAEDIKEKAPEYVEKVKDAVDDVFSKKD